MRAAVRYRTGCFPKQCGCGRVYSEEAWMQLPDQGIWPGMEERTGKRYGPDLEMRNCSCDSTIAVPIEEAL